MGREHIVSCEQRLQVAMALWLMKHGNGFRNLDLPSPEAGPAGKYREGGWFEVAASMATSEQTSFSVDHDEAMCLERGRSSLPRAPCQ